jgi:hypothetical protein
MNRLRSTARPVCRSFWIFATLFSISAQAQPQSGMVAPVQDPLMTLMLAQPRIEILSNVTAQASFDPPVIRPGEKSIFRVSFDALEESIDWEGKVPAPPALGLHPGAHGQFFQMTGTNQQPRTTFNFHAQPAASGSFTIPEFTVKVYGKPVVVPAARLEVTPTPQAPAPPAQVLFLELASTNLYIGQPVRARILQYHLPGGVVQGLAQVQVSGQGFLVDATSVRQRIENLRRNEGNVITYIYETTLTPFASGKLTAVAQAFCAGGRFTGTGTPAVVTAAPLQYTLLDSEPVEFTVKPLPREGLLPGFTGAVGFYAIEKPTLPTDLLEVGTPVTLTVKVRGTDSLHRLVPPPPPRLAEWQVLAHRSDNQPSPVIQAQGFVTFSYTLIPLTDKVKTTPPIPFCAFDPQRGEYFDLTIEPVPVAVRPAGTPADFLAVQRAEASTPPAEKPPVLSGLAARPGPASATLIPLQKRALFPLMQLAPAAAFLGLWAWDRRRRYFELHPDVLLRKRARRALRRQRKAILRAAKDADPPRYLEHAVAALRTAAAPHYPAEPRALVCGDILPLLPEWEQAGPGGVVVRRFFAAEDAARFNQAEDDRSGLLASAEDLNRILDLLEARL